jgi:hypothetical protein
MDLPSLVLWWIPKGHRPSVAEAIGKLDLLRASGSTSQAFTFGQVFAPPLIRETPEDALKRLGSTESAL